MFLNWMDTKDGQQVSKLARQSSTFNAFYKYWRDALFERVMRLFVWENTGDVPPKEIEQRLILAGHCGVTKILNEQELTVMFGDFFNPTKYYDEKKQYTVRCPIYSGTRWIDKDIIIINNNSLRNPTYELIHHYAIMLAHTEVTLTNCLINARDAGGIPIAPTEKQKKSIKDYQSKIFNGQYDVVVDLGMLGVDYAGTDRKTSQNIMDIMEVREKMIKSFYSDIGVRSAFEKRNNTVQAEVEADTSLLLLNLSDMIKCREDGCKKVNALYGTNWSVHVAEEIDYNAENARIQFDTNTEVHMEEKTDVAENS